MKYSKNSKKYDFKWFQKQLKTVVHLKHTFQQRTITTPFLPEKKILSTKNTIIFIINTHYSRKNKKII